jgi:hypothetical protein
MRRQKNGVDFVGEDCVCDNAIRHFDLDSGNKPEYHHHGGCVLVNHTVAHPSCIEGGHVLLETL